MNTKKILSGFGLFVALGLSLAACSDNDNNGTPDSGVVPDAGSGPPAAPTLGDMIDRMGRPGINTAITDPFNTTMMAAQDAYKDAYNKAAKTTWNETYKSKFASVLAIYDGLDRNCGNQFAAAMQAMPMAGRYDTLAGVLADDQLYVNSASGTCTQYLGVEAAFAGVTLFAGDCGGRMPAYDVIDTTYSLLAVGMIAGVTDGVANDSTFMATFPFLAAPNP